MDERQKELMIVKKEKEYSKIIEQIRESDPLIHLLNNMIN
jgi:hypothetical protein